MKSKCLYCYKPTEDGQDFHKKCSSVFFNTKKSPKMEYSLDHLGELAKNIVERSVSVPGVQAKLSISLVKRPKENADNRLTVLRALGGQYIFKPPNDRFPEIP